MLKHSSKRAVVVFKQKFTDDILNLETDFEYAHACFSLLLSEFTTSLSVTEAITNSNHRLLAQLALFEFAEACAVYSRFDLHESILSQLTQSAARDPVTKTRFC